MVIARHTARTRSTRIARNPQTPHTVDEESSPARGTPLSHRSCAKNSAGTGPCNTINIKLIYGDYRLMKIPRIRLCCAPRHLISIDNNMFSSYNNSGHRKSQSDLSLSYPKTRAGRHTTATSRKPRVSIALRGLTPLGDTLVTRTSAKAHALDLLYSSKSRHIEKHIANVRQHRHHINTSQMYAHCRRLGRKITDTYTIRWYFVDQ